MPRWLTVAYWRDVSRQKREYKAVQARIGALPDDYRFVYRRIEKYLWNHAGGDGMEMLTVLTPEEKFEYELRLSQPAILLRTSMGGFEPTEEEFRQMFQAAKKCSDKFGFGVLTRLGNIHPGDGQANETLDAIRTALGEQRFQEFQKRRLVASVQK